MQLQCKQVFRVCGIASFVVFCVLYGSYQYYSYYGYYGYGNDEPSNEIEGTGLPDLVPDAYMIQVSAYLDIVPMSRLQCALSENCLARSAWSTDLSDKRKLLRFALKTGNDGDADFNPELPRRYWVWHSCHQHYHSMDSFSYYDLLDTNSGARAAEGHKPSWCLENTGCGYSSRRTDYNCHWGTQGISSGCWDTYNSHLDCQWVDVTDVNPGFYVLEVAVNHNRRVKESDYSNNRVRCDVILEKSGAYVYNCITTDLRGLGRIYG